ncbi:hypothetical protein Prudu_003286, partial [Prunus dulcis]
KWTADMEFSSLHHRCVWSPVRSSSSHYPLLFSLGRQRRVGRRKVVLRERPSHDEKHMLIHYVAARESEYLQLMGENDGGLQAWQLDPRAHECVVEFYLFIGIT